MYVQSFKDLIVWQKSIDLAISVYKETEKLPKAETYGLISQMRRASIAIPSNIAEGKKRKTSKDFLQFLCIADGSAAELETQIILTKNLYPHISFTIAERLLTEIQKMLITIIRKLEASKS